MDWSQDGNEMDIVLNTVRHEKELASTHKKAFEALSLVMERCRGYLLQPNGFWVLPEEMEDGVRNVQEYVSQPLTGTYVANPAAQARNRLIAEERAQVKRYSWMRAPHVVGIG